MMPKWGARAGELMMKALAEITHPPKEYLLPTRTPSPFTGYSRPAEMHLKTFLTRASPVFAFADRFPR